MEPEGSFNITAGLAYIQSHPHGPEPTDGNGSLGVTALEYRMAQMLLDIRSKTLQKYTPYITALTVLLLAKVLTRRLLIKGSWRVRDLWICGACLYLLYTAEILLVLLSSNVAFGYLTWILLPSSSASRKLPSYEHFMLNLPTLTPPQDGTASTEPDRCIICWENENDTTIARLPCNHNACTTCLTHLESSDKSTCPLCSRHLWRKKYQSLNIALQKLRIASYAINIYLYLLSMIYWLRYGEYKKALWQIPILLVSTIIPLAVKVVDVRAGRRDWWLGAQIRGVGWEWAPAVFMVVMKWWEIYQAKLSDIGDDFTITVTPASNSSANAL